MKKHLRLWRATVALLATLLSLPDSHAEGSKNLTPGTNNDVLTAQTNDRAGFLVHDSDPASGGIDIAYGFLKPASWVSASGATFSPDYRLYVRLLPGEKLSYGVRRAAPLVSVAGTNGVYQDLIITLRYGSGEGTIVNQNTLARASTSTNTYQLATQAGVIDSYAQAAAGPGVAGGYVPLTYTNNTGEAQDFFVEFTQNGEYTSQGTQGGYNDLKTRNASFNSQRYSVYDLWDFTVTNSSNQTKPGRMFSKFWAFSTGPSSGNNTFLNRLSRNFTLYPLIESRATADTYYVKAIELGGLRPYAFFFVTNEFGSITGTGRTTVEQRRRSQTSNFAYAQYPSFVDAPDPAIWPDASIPTVSVTPQAFCRSGQTEVAFTTSSSETGVFDITITYSGRTKKISTTVTAGSSATVVWDGTVGTGGSLLRVPANTAISYSFVNRGVAVNFPLYDAEGNEGGFVVRNVRPSAAGTDLLYWDDTNLSGFPTPTVQLDGTNASNAGHPWGNGTNSLGDGYLVNSWTYGFVSTASTTTYTTIDACDNDGDGVADATDIDDDNDGILDVVEAYSGTSNIDPGAFASAQSPIRYLDAAYVHPVLGAFRDVNNDGVNDIFDTDRDGIPNHFDLDSDDDGIPDAIEANGNVVPSFTFTGNAGNGTNNYTVTSSYNPTTSRYEGRAYRTSNNANITLPSGIGAGVGRNGLPDAVEGTTVTYTGSYTNAGVTENGNPTSRYNLTDNDNDSYTTGSQTIRNYNFLDIDSDNDGITDEMEALSTAVYNTRKAQANFNTDTNRNGIRDAYDPSNGGTAIGTPVNSDGTDLPDMFDTDSDNDNTGNASKAINLQTADWSEGFANPAYGVSGGEIIARARLFALNNPEKAGYYPVYGPASGVLNSPFLLDADNDKIPNFLDLNSPYYHDDNFNGLVDIYDPAYGGTPSTAPKGAASASDAAFRVNANGSQVPLPVELIGFQAKPAGRNALVTWATASEKDNARFLVERSTDATTFVVAGTVEGKGTTSSRSNYSFTDKNVGTSAGTLYYRLRQMDQDGKESVSEVRVVSFDGKAAATAISTYPSPTVDNATLDLLALPTVTYAVEIMAADGRLMTRFEAQGGREAVLPVAGYAKGTYLVRVSGQGQNYLVKLLKN